MTLLLPQAQHGITALALAAVFCLASAPGEVQAQAGRANRSGDFIVAVVNTEAVTSVEVAQRLERASAEARRAGATLPDTSTLRQQVLDSLIDERVQITFAREVGQKCESPTDGPRVVTRRCPLARSKAGASSA